jgi:alkylation response protein AidB-like acyl-CoA dehydrogenase
MRDLGWFEIVGPDATTDLTYLGLLVEELGRAVVPSPYFETMSAVLLAERLGPESTARELLERLRSGSLRAAIAGPRIRASDCIHVGRPDGSGAMFTVEWGNAADVLLVPSVNPEAGDEVAVDAVFLPADAVQVVGAHCMDNIRSASVTLADDVERVRLGNLSLESLDEHLAVVRMLRGLDMLGTAQKAMDLTVAYVQERHQFGEPLSAFQAVQHMCADMKIECDAARLMLYEALSTASKGLPAFRQASMSALVAARAAERVTQNAAQLHGGIGFMAEYRLQFYFRRAKAQQMRNGVVAEQLSHVAHVAIRPRRGWGARAFHGHQPAAR